MIRFGHARAADLHSPCRNVACPAPAAATANVTVVPNAPLRHPPLSPGATETNSCLARGAAQLVRTLQQRAGRDRPSVRTLTHGLAARRIAGSRIILLFTMRRSIKLQAPSTAQGLAVQLQLRGQHRQGRHAATLVAALHSCWLQSSLTSFSADDACLCPARFPGNCAPARVLGWHADLSGQSPAGHFRPGAALALFSLTPGWLVQY